jgi:hypothetical protein
MACATRCTIHLTSSTTVPDSIPVVFALPITLDTSQRLQLVHMASWSVSLTRCVCFDIAIVPLAFLAYPIDMIAEVFLDFSERTRQLEAESGLYLWSLPSKYQFQFDSTNELG